MKKFCFTVFSVLLILAVLVGCGGDQPGSTEKKTAAEIYSEIQTAVQLPEMMQLDADYIDAYYGIDVSQLSDYSFNCAVDAMMVDTVIIASVADNADVESITASLGNIRDMKIVELESYAPDLAQIVKDGEIIASGNTVCLVISKDIEDVKKIINKYI